MSAYGDLLVVLLHVVLLIFVIRMPYASRMLGNRWYLSFYFPSHSSFAAADIEEVQAAFKWSCFFLLVTCATPPE